MGLAVIRKHIRLLPVARDDPTHELGPELAAAECLGCGVVSTPCPSGPLRLLALNAKRLASADMSLTHRAIIGC